MDFLPLTYALALEQLGEVGATLARGGVNSMTGRRVTDIAVVLPGQLGIGVYSPPLDAKGNSVRGVRVCRSLSQRLGLHFLTVTRELRSTIRAIYEPSENVCVYEIHGDLPFAGARTGDPHGVPVRCGGIHQSRGRRQSGGALGSDQPPSSTGP